MAVVEEPEDKTSEHEKCDCCTPFDPAKFVDVDNPSYFTEKYLKKRPFQPRCCIGCDREFTLKIELETASPDKYFSMKKGRSKGPPRVVWFCVVANDAHTDDCMSALCNPCYQDLQLNKQVEKKENRTKVFPNLEDASANGTA